jgi:hypothetical protein
LSSLTNDAVLLVVTNMEKSKKITNCGNGDRTKKGGASLNKLDLDSNLATLNKFILLKQELARLEILDDKGKVIRVLKSGKLLPGNYSSEFETSTIPSGVYFYRIKTDSYSKTNKLIIQH